MMKRFLGLAVLIFGLSVPAHAQARAGGGMAGMSGSGAAGGTATSSGGGIGGGSQGVTNFNTLPVFPPAKLPSSAVSGSDRTFEPSTFLPYDEAIAAGQQVLDAEHKSLVEAAAESSRQPRLKAKAEIIENAAGDPVIATP
ncbi:MAG TPA: hypothetical protein VHX36_07325 [Candidatus Acidoferrales bacterium]|jgi:hypothetical protein|nr:hypothetical protein [Candidatus Acidoferrales bacterium]